MRWRWGATVFVLAAIGAFAPASADPTPCTVVDQVATCTLDQSDGIFFSTVPVAGSHSDPAGVVAINTQNLTTPIAPSGLLQLLFVSGISLHYDLGNVSPVNPGAAGIAAPALSIHTDAGTAINLTGSAANAGIATPVNSAINVFTRGGAGNNGAPPSGFLTGDAGPAGNGAAGGNVTIVNGGPITSVLTSTPQSRVVTFNLGGLLGDYTNALNFANDGLACLALATNVCDASNNQSVNYFTCYFGKGQIITLFTGVPLCINGNFTGTRQDLAAAITQTRNYDQTQIDYLNAPPAPGESSGDIGAPLINGAISVTSVGGNGGGTYGIFFDRVSGNGGKGGDIAIINVSTIAVTAAAGSTGGNSAGISAVSQGGVGGSGVDIFNPLPGVSGFGGDGGTVTVTNNGTITTATVSSPGIFAQSIGGLEGVFTLASGGMGGLVDIYNNGTIATTAGSSYGIYARSLGGDGITGVTGGAGGLARVDNQGDVSTTGIGADGIYAISQGGRGGHGADAGNGGDGGAGGNVVVTTGAPSHITTAGADAIGIYGLSTAGIGGVGDADSGVFYADAGGGGNGGVGHDVKITSAGTIVTGGAYAYGIFGQSLGGTGGYGGSAAALVASSGSGGGGAPSGDIALENSGSITTTGVGANGLYAQSLAGQGGDGGSSGGLVALGADGGDGAKAQCAADPSKCLNGGTVIVRNLKNITTHGVNADGILAESIGGGGGNGGSSSGLFSYGGSGGAGGNGGKVAVLNDVGAAIVTTGDSAIGVFAQSVGGGGGKGGNATSFGTAGSVAIGGSGGTGGIGDSVTVTNNGVISVTGIGATGIFAQSIGGGGGAGGDATSLSFSVSVAVGGSGGDGGKGGSVAVTNTKFINVAGYGDTAIFAQSVGGGGGKGGDASSFSAGVVTASISVGGKGGGGGSAGDLVTVTNGGSIATSGDFADAIFAQSIGGGGGDGGAAYSFAASGGPDFSASIAVAVGGSGAVGGAGNHVVVSNTGTILTLDWNSRGIFAQSVGGGGGDGGSSTAKALAASDGPTAAASIAVGGSGAGGGNGGRVDVTNSGTITTFGELSYPVFAQSIGGGGGNGGDASTTTYTLTAGKSANVNVSVGGNAGAGGNGGIVSVVNTGTIIALGNETAGITAQSVGGGGGNGGAGTQEDLFDFIDLPTTYDKDVFNKNLKDQARDKFNSLQKSAKEIAAHPGTFGKNLVKDQLSGAGEKPQSVGVSIGVGGTGGAGGFGDVVTVINSKEIITGGFMGFGIMAQSIGGGGGMGGGGDASGSGDINIGAGVGGAGGLGNKGGAVTVTNTGDITTFGALAYGIVAQSIGGGGGIGGAGGGESDGARSFSLSIGGHGGGQDPNNLKSSDGDVVTVLQNGNVVTVGGSAIGVLAQSIGGGGGAGGTANAANTNNVSLGGSGGGGGDGKLVDVTVNGSVATLGDFAHGVLAQSIGGGGGLAAGIEASTLVAGVGPFGTYNIDTGIPYSAGNLGFGGSGGDGGSGGPISIHTAGTISTSGRAAYGIFAQTIGGSGGSGGSGGNPFPAAIAVSGSNGGHGTAGAITIVHNGSIFATGVNSHGILAQSQGGADQGGIGGDITITLLGGTISGGTGGGTGIFLSGGHDNRIDNRGGTITALSGLAIIGSNGNDVVENSGLIKGDVGLGGGSNSFHNAAQGTFESGRFVFINTGSTLVSDGTLSPFGGGFAGTTNLSGNLTQHAGGVFLVDVNFKGGASDLVAMDGTATLAGKVLLGPHHVTDLVAGHYVTILSAGAVADTGISINDTLVIDYNLRVQGTNFQIGVDSVRFVLPGALLTPNEAAIAGQLQDVWVHGGAAPLTPLMDYLAGLNDPATYSATLASLDPGNGQPQSSALLFSAINFTNGMMSCPGSGDPSESLEEHDCYWGRIGGTGGHQVATGGSVGYRSSGVRFQLGRQFALAPHWFVGVSGGFEQNRIDTGSAAHGSGRVYSLGVAGKYQVDTWTVAVGVDAVYGDNKLLRSVTFPTNLAAVSAPRQTFVDAKLRVSDVLRSGAFYAKPSLEADLYYVDMPSFRETGAGALNIITSGSRKVFGSGSLGLEIGAITEFDDGSVLRPYVSGGILAFNDHRWEMQARFEGSPPGLPGFTVTNNFPGLLGRMTAGIEASLGEGTFRAEYETRFGQHYSDQTGTLKLELRL